jgi:uncharacterized protein
LPEATLIAVFLAGLLGGGHCAAMCGGIVTALSAGAPARLGLHLAYNTGRIASYTAAGAIAGGAGALILIKDLLPLQIALYVFANLMLVLLGLYLAGVSSLITQLEPLGRRLWRLISPLTRKLIPADTAPRALAAGGLWGWLPCGLTYSVLTIALVSGSGLRGASLMLAFGLGTLPNLLAAGMVLGRFRRFLAARWLRVTSGALVLGFGLLGLARASQVEEQLRRGILCLI